MTRTEFADKQKALRAEGKWPVRSSLDKKPPMMHTTTALTPALHDRLERLAAEQGKAKSTVLREAFELYLEAEDEAATQRADYENAKRG